MGSACKILYVSRELVLCVCFALTTTPTKLRCAHTVGATLLLPSLLMHISAGRFTNVVVDLVISLLRKTLTDDGALYLLHFLNVVISTVCLRRFIFFSVCQNNICVRVVFFVLSLARLSVARQRSIKSPAPFNPCNRTICVRGRSASLHNVCCAN